MKLSLFAAIFSSALIANAQWVSVYPEINAGGTGHGFQPDCSGACIRLSDIGAFFVKSAHLWASSGGIHTTSCTLYSNDGCAQGTDFQNVGDGVTNTVQDPVAVRCYSGC